MTLGSFWGLLDLGFQDVVGFVTRALTRTSLKKYGINIFDRVSLLWLEMWV